MNVLDLLITVVLLIFILFGFKRGLAREIMSLLAWVVSVVSAWLLADQVGAMLPATIKEETTRVLAGFVIVFLVVYLLSMLLKKKLHKAVVSRNYLKLPNYLFGAVFGLARGGFVILVVILVSGLTDLPRQDWWRESQMARQMEPVAVRASKFLPRDIARRIRYG